ncbi:MAG: hypothetical protein LBE08_01825 [Bifidobacteriaceae bacterium]|jgi:hypothetical protein|nr:hypothetical protein [Bifidobacteriaceae bacterium]
MEPMSAGELRVIRQFLGLSADQLGALLGVAGRSVRRWESSERDEHGAVRWPIPDGIRQAVERLEDAAATEVGAMVRYLREMPDPGIVTFRTDAEMAAAHPGTRLPASWHRAIVGRAIQEVPAVRVAFLSDALDAGATVQDVLMVAEPAQASLR